MRVAHGRGLTGPYKVSPKLELEAQDNYCPQGHPQDETPTDPTKGREMGRGRDKDRRRDMDRGRGREK